MKLYGMLYNGKPQTSATQLTGASLVHPIKAFKESRQLLILHPTTIIFKSALAPVLIILNPRYVDILSA
jgi:hypothetical protein